MFFFPIRSDHRLRSTPWVNYTLIAVNVVVFLFTYNRVNLPMDPVQTFMLYPRSANLMQFFTYQFLHQNLMHLLGNMLFLYVFGNSVEDRFGKLGYLGFYLAGGVMAGLGHCLTSDAQVLGASGAVSAVTGAYLVLAPMSNITIFYWLVFIWDTFEVSSLVLILFQIAQNIFFELAGGGGVAYTAHLAGYAFGIAVAVPLVGLRILSREPFDLLALIEHRRRRIAFQAQTRQGYSPWESSRVREPSPAGPADPRDAANPDPAQRRLMDLRADIHAALERRELPAAADLYVKLLSLDPAQVMSQDHQLDLANRLMAEERYEPAARAYELFLGHFRGYPQREQIEMILGLIYANYLNRLQRARELLAAALPRLSDPDQIELAKRTLEEIG